MASQHNIVIKHAFGLANSITVSVNQGNFFFYTFFIFFLFLSSFFDTFSLFSTFFAASRRRSKLEKLKAAEKERLGQKPPLAGMFWLLKVLLSSSSSTSSLSRTSTYSHFFASSHFIPEMSFFPAKKQSWSIFFSTPDSASPCWTSSTPASRLNTHWEAFLDCETLLKQNYRIVYRYQYQMQILC